MRYDVKKYLFVGSESDRVVFFKQAQEAGIIHFINSNSQNSQGVSPEIQRMIHAIKIIRELPVVPQEETTEYGIANAMVQKIIDLKTSLNQLWEEERMIKLEISRVQIFGNFSIDELTDLAKAAQRKVQFFCAKQGIKEQEILPDELIYIGSDHGLDYFTAINRKNVQYPNMIEIIIEKPFGELKQKLLAIQKQIHLNETRLKEFAKYKTFLHHALVEVTNLYLLEKAKQQAEFSLDKTLFTVQGFVPFYKLKELEELLKNLNVFAEEVSINPDEVVPTYLENQGISKIGEDLVSIYDTPSSSDKDPSVWVIFFFALFFSMIIGDGGYGLVLLAVALYLRYKHSAIKGLKKRILNLMTILSFSCIVWGVLTTSFFGITIAPDNPVRSVSVMSWLVEKKADYHIKHQDEVFQEWVKKDPALEKVSDPVEFLMKASSVNQHGKISYDAYNKFADNIIMELALLVGVLHLIISMGRYLDRNLINLGWIIFMIGAYLYVPIFLHASSILNFAFGIDPSVGAANGLYLIYGGMSLAVVIAIFKHKWLGLLEASVVIQIFGDVLSYLRLYALGLAGGLLTATMIDLASAVPFVFGVLILVFGHVVNIVLGIMGGVIHGLRLNFLEWYHYSFEGGGKMFNPLRKHELE